MQPVATPPSALRTEPETRVHPVPSGTVSAHAHLDLSLLAPGSTRFESAGDRRRRTRCAARALDRLEVSLLPGSGAAPAPARLRDFHPLGLGLEMPAEAVRILPAPGSEVAVRLSLPGQPEAEVACRLLHAHPGPTGIRLGLERLDVQRPGDGEPLVAPESAPAPLPGPSIRARIEHPFLFDHVCGLTVLELRRDLEMVFLTHDPSLLVVEGGMVDMRFDLPGADRHPMRMRVGRLEAVTPESLRFSARCVSMDLALHRALSSHLLGPHRWTPARLRKAGFQGRAVRGQLVYGTVSTQEDYAEVLRLRRDAYVRVGKRDRDTTPERMSGALDGRSRILTARHHGRLVGSMSWAYPDSEDLVIDTQKGFPGEAYPVAMPPKRDLIEIARLCVDEAYRGTDVVMGLFAQGALHFLLSDRRWLLTSATKDMLPLYKEIGFKRTGAFYAHHLLQGKEHHLLLLDKRDLIFGRRMGPVAWNRWVGGVFAYLVDRGLLDLSPLERLGVGMNRALGPLVRRLDARRAEREFRDHLAAKAKRKAAGAA